MLRRSFHTALVALLLPLSTGCLATRSRLTEYEPYDAREGAEVATLRPDHRDGGFPVPAPTAPQLLPVPGNEPLTPPAVPPSEDIPEPPGVGLPPSPNRTIQWSKPSTWFRSIRHAFGSNEDLETQS